MSQSHKHSLSISPELGLPLESATWVIAYLAKRGGGKTYNAAVQAEEMLKAGIPIVVIDGMGIWYGLRIGKQGKGDGLPIIVFGGEHGDLPLIPEKAEEMAKSIVESNVSCVIDTSDLSRNQSRKVVTDFLNQLYKINRQDRHVFIEEADMFAPQRPMGEDAVCLGAVDNFVRRGGNHNLGCTLITQRSAVLNKNILTQADCLMVGRTLAPQDKEAVQAWVEEYSEKDKTEIKRWLDSLKELGNGEFYIWHPDKPVIFEKVTFRERETFHATREFIKSPESQQIKLMDVGSFVSRFRNVFQEKAKDIKPISLRTREELISDCLELERQLRQTSETVQNNLGKITSKDEEIKKLGQQLDSVRAKLVECQHTKTIEVPRTGPLSPLTESEMVDRILKQVMNRIPSSDLKNDNADLSLTKTDLNVEIKHKDVVVEKTTERVDGQILYVLKENGELTNREIRSACAEYGWAFEEKTCANNLSSLKGEGLVIQIDKGKGHADEYRLPTRAEFEIKKTD